MALQSRIVNGSLTEIYAGGGNFVTEAFPTNFHTFAPKRILLDGQSTDDYKEVTPAERSAIEAADAKWEEWPESTIAEWNTACGSDGGYNAKTGFGELNGLTDLTLSDARRILLFGRKPLQNYGYSASYLPFLRIRTNLPPLGQDTIKADCKFLFGGQIDMEVACVHPGWRSPSANYRVSMLTDTSGVFGGCTKLRKILGRFTLNANGENIFYNCQALEELSLGITRSVSLSQSPKLSFESVKYMVEHASNTSPITITVHADVYAKITDEANAEWHALLAAAAEKNITFATT